MSLHFLILYVSHTFIEPFFFLSSKMAGVNANALVEKQLVAATQIIEQQLDAEIERLDNLDSDDLDAIRRERLEAMKKRQNKKQEWINNVGPQRSPLNILLEFFDIVYRFYVDHWTYQVTTFNVTCIDSPSSSSLLYHNTP